MPTKQNDAVKALARKLADAVAVPYVDCGKQLSEVLIAELGPLLEAAEAGKMAAMQELIELQDRLLVCYRTNSRPSGATLDRLRAVRAELKRMGE